MKEDETTAQIRLFRITSAGDKSPIDVRIGKPRCDGANWKCPISLEGLYESVPDVCGDDSLQSLCLAVRLVGKLLMDFQQQGHRIVFEHGDKKYDFPFEAYFGKLEQS